MPKKQEVDTPYKNSWADGMARKDYTINLEKTLSYKIRWALLLEKETRKNV